jgi:hypothetical protein
MIDDRVGVVIETVEDGSDHWVQFQGADVAGNGPTITPLYTIQVDTEGPIFEGFRPGENEKQNGTTVDISVVISDGLAGVNGSSIHLRYRTDGENPMGAWVTLSNEKVGELHRYNAVLDLLPGIENHVQFKASDLVGNEALSRTYTVWVNRPPEAAISKPQDGEPLRPDEPVIFSSIGTRDLDNEQLNLTWEVLETGQELGHSPEISIFLAPGHHTIILTVRDESGSKDSATVQITVEEFPPEVHVYDPQIVMVIVLILAILISVAVAYRIQRARE